MFIPFSFQLQSSENAIRRGWNKGIVVLTRMFPYLTLYTQMWTIIAMYNLTPATMYIAQTMSWFVFFLYHGFNYMGPDHLAYHPEEFVNEVVRWKPPMNSKIFVWFGLHWQHTIFPFYLHYLTNKYNIEYRYDYTMILYNFASITVYIIWHSFCWYVHEVAAYPFLNILRETSNELAFYLFGFSVNIIINCIIAGLWKELFFYLVGMLNIAAIFGLYLIFH